MILSHTSRGSLEFGQLRVTYGQDSRITGNRACPGWMLRRLGLRTTHSAHEVRHFRAEYGVVVGACPNIIRLASSLSGGRMGIEKSDFLYGRATYSQNEIGIVLVPAGGERNPWHDHRMRSP